LSNSEYTLLVELGSVFGSDAIQEAEIIFLGYSFPATSFEDAL
jgi:hypothetical protein